MQHTIRLEAVATARLFGSTWSATGPQGTNTTVSGINAGETAVNRAFIRFGAFEIPSYANIVSAVLQVYVSARSSSSGYTHSIYPVTDNGTLWTPQSRNGAAWSTAVRNTIYLSSDGRWVSASVIDIANAWKDGGADPERGLCIFSEAHGSWKQFDGALRANRPRLTIVYDVPASVPVPNKSALALGESLTTNLIANEAGASHVITYRIGETVLATYDIGTATSHSYTVPTSAGSNFSNALTATLTVEVTTTVNGETRGSVTHEVTLTLPADAAPTAACTVARTWAEGVSGEAQIDAFVQRKSGANFAVSGSARYGASVVSRQVRVEGTVYTAEGASGNISHALIVGSGEVGYVYAVTDSRGLTREYAGSLTVLAWSEPEIVRFSIARVTEEGVEAVDGTCARASVQASVSGLEVSGAEQNHIEYYVRYREAGTEEWISGDTVTVAGTSVDAEALIYRQSAPADDFNDMSGYEFQLVLADIYAASVAADEMPTKDVRLCLDQNTGSIGFGGEAVFHSGGPEYDFYGLVRAHGALSAAAGIEGVTNHAAAEVATGGRWVDGRPIYRLSGMYAGTLTNGAQNNFPLGIAPIHTVIRADVFTRGAPADGSTGYWWFPATYNNATSGNVNYSISYLINNCHSDPSLRVIVSSGMDVRGRQLAYCIEYTKVADAPTYYFLPYLALASDQDCVISVSSEFSNAYYSVYAFGGSVSGRYWACAAADAERWIQVQMPYKLKNMIIKLTSPVGGGSEAQYMPIAGTFQGSNNGTAWTQIGTFADRPDTVGGVTEHTLANAVGYKYLRIQITQPGAGVWTGFGDIRVQGEVEAETDS